jgi:hypothetical protein
MNKKCFVVVNPAMWFRDYIVCTYLAVSEDDVYKKLYDEGYGEMDNIKSNYEVLEKHFEEIPSLHEIREQKINKILKED